jgi:hypothetical protein
MFILKNRMAADESKTGMFAEIKKRQSDNG